MQTFFLYAVWIKLILEHLGVMYPVLVPIFPLLYLKVNKQASKSKYQENSLKAEGNTLSSGCPYCVFVVVNKHLQVEKRLEIKSLRSETCCFQQRKEMYRKYEWQQHSPEKGEIK